MLLYTKTALALFTSVILLQTGDLTPWLKFGMSGIVIGFLMIYVVKPIVQANIENTKRVTAAIEQMSKDLVAFRSDFNTHAKGVLDRLNDIEQELEQIKNS